MAWIKSHQELARHPKTLKLAKILDVSIPAALGHLHMLWWWSMDYAPDGDLTDFDRFDLALACGWDGDPDVLIDALIGCGPGESSGFLDLDDDGLWLHDWDEYGGKLHEKREQDAARKRRARARRRKAASDGRDEDNTPEQDQSAPRPQDVRTPSTGRDEDIRETAHVEERRGEQTRVEHGGADAPAVAIDTVQVDGFDAPMPIKAPGGLLTPPLLAWAIDHGFTERPPPDPAGRADVCLQAVAECLGTSTEATKAAQQVCVELVEQVTGERQPSPLWGHIGRLVTTMDKRQLAGALVVALEAGAGLTGSYVNDPLALTKYATAVVRRQDAA